MGWIIGSLIVIAAIIGYTLLLNARPARCPSCNKVNVFRRTRTGHRRDLRDEEGDLRRRSTAYRCRRCEGRYWIVWDDFAGRRTSLSPNTDSAVPLVRHPD